MNKAQFHEQLDEYMLDYRQPFHYLTAPQLRAKIAADPAVSAPHPQLYQAGGGRQDQPVPASLAGDPSMARPPLSAYVRLHNRSCGESTAVLLRRSPYELYFAEAGSFIGRVSGSLMALWVQAHMTDDHLARIRAAGDIILREAHQLDQHIIQTALADTSSPEAIRLLRFLARAQQYPVRTRSYTLHVVAWLVCGLALAATSHLAADC